MADFTHGDTRPRHPAVEANAALVDAPEGSCAVIHSDDAELTQRLNQEAAAALARETRPCGKALAPIVGMEQDAGVLEQARSNAKAAGVAEALDLRQGDCRDFEPPPEPGSPAYPPQPAAAARHREPATMPTH